MKLPRRNFLHLAAGAAALPAVSRFAFAQAYPSRPVRLIGPYTPGGASDTVARLMGQWLSQRLGQPFTIENRPGASTWFTCPIVVADRHPTTCSAGRCRSRFPPLWHLSAIS